jgi:hypothetical protein
LLTQLEARAQHVQVALDGKTLRGTLGHAAPDQQSVHLVTLYETQTGIVLAQQAVPDKSNEITLEATLLTPSQVNGRIVTADAMHTQRTCCAAIHRFGGYYVLLAKANQPTDGERIYASSSRSRLSIVVIGGRRTPGVKGMGDENSANSLPAQS